MVHIVHAKISLLSPQYKSSSLAATMGEINGSNDKNNKYSALKILHHSKGFYRYLTLGPPQDRTTVIIITTAVEIYTWKNHILHMMISSAVAVVKCILIRFFLSKFSSIEIEFRHKT